VIDDLIPVHSPRPQSLLLHHWRCSTPRSTKSLEASRNRSVRLIWFTICSYTLRIAFKLQHAPSPYSRQNYASDYHDTILKHYGSHPESARHISTFYFSSIINKEAAMEDKIVSPSENDDKTLFQAVSEVDTMNKELLPPAPTYSSIGFDTASNLPIHGRRHILSEPVRIKTRELTLASGFEYNRLLFDLRIDPGKWDEFSSDVTRATRLNTNDKAAVIATIAGFSMLGLVGIGIVLSERVQNNKKLKRLMANREEGGLLAQVLDSWNDHYFHHFGVRAWIEIHEAALRNQAKKTGKRAPGFVRPERTFVEKTPLVVLNKESRKRRKEEKKYMVVLDPLESAELEGSRGRPMEMASTTCARELHSDDLNELAGDLPCSPTETSDPFADPLAYSGTVSYSSDSKV
jgi:hypothetical protein